LAVSSWKSAVIFAASASPHSPPILLNTESTFIWGEREDIDGNVGSDYRVQFTLKVDFDTGDLIQKN
jgi:hypothetical protein